MDKIYGYARCSTNETKQNIDRQGRELSKCGVPAENIYWEFDHGTNDDRIELPSLLQRFPVWRAVRRNSVKS